MEASTIVLAGPALVGLICTAIKQSRRKKLERIAEKSNTASADNQNSPKEPMPR